jgi:hypothetical protein
MKTLCYVEMQIKKTIQFISLWFEPKDDIQFLTIQFMKDSKVILESSSPKDINQFIKSKIPFDFYIYNKKNQINKFVSNKWIGFDELFINLYEKKETSYRPGFIQFMNGFKCFCIEFKTKVYNFYMEENLFTPEFMKYFVKTYYYHDTIYWTDYEIQYFYIDKLVTLTKKNNLLIKKESFEIL